jgi:hypothetical protein
VGQAGGELPGGRQAGGAAEVFHAVLELLVGEAELAGSLLQENALAAFAVGEYAHDASNQKEVDGFDEGIFAVVGGEIEDLSLIHI